MSGNKASKSSSTSNKETPSSSTQPPKLDKDNKTAGNLPTASGRAKKSKRKGKLPRANQIREKMRKLNAQQSESLQKAEELEERVDSKKKESAASSSNAHLHEETQQEIDELMDSVGEKPFLE